MDMPTSYYINRDTDIARNKNIVAMFSKNNLSNYKKFSAIPLEKIKDYLNSTEGLMLTDPEISCVISHLLVIEEGLSSGLDYFIVFEDDINIDTMCQFSFSFKDFIEKLPKDWEIVQLCSHGDYFKKQYYPKLLPWEPEYFGTAAYLIKSSYAKKLISYYKNGSSFDILRFFEQKHFLSKIKNENIKNPAADRLVYSLGISYTINLFSFFNFKSTISDNIEKQKREKTVSKRILNFWKNETIDLDSFFNTSTEKE
jgi:GR25 family glycosyltransferase involved in LPS biosynthesis